jgi:chromate reductase
MQPDHRHLNVLGIAGSLREGSYNRALLHAAQELAPDTMTITVFDLADIPLYNADDDGSVKPEPVERLKAAIAEADALLIATPEYNHGIPGVLKNALDWASRPVRRSPMAGKPTAIMGAATGMWGTIRAQTHLRTVLAAMNTPTVLKPEVLVRGAREKFDQDGRLIDEATRRFVRELLDNLAGLTLRLRDEVREPVGV